MGIEESNTKATAEANATINDTSVIADEITGGNVKDTRHLNEKSGMTLDEPFKDVKPSTSDPPQAPKPQIGNQRTEETSNMVTPLEQLGETPTFIDCPYCKKRTKTKVEKNDSSQTTIAAALCCLFCGIITVCIPSLCHWCADIDHRCSECGKQVSHKPHDGPVQARYPTGPLQRPSQYAAMPAHQRQRLQLPPVEEGQSTQQQGQPTRQQDQPTRQQD